MALAFTSLSYWLRGATNHECCNSVVHSTSDLPFVYKKPNSVNFFVYEWPRMRLSLRRLLRMWQSREERKIRIDMEHDMVIVPSEGGCLSGSESDDSDWSFGRMETHASDFHNDDRFVILVPYSRGRCEMMGNLNC